LRDSIDCVYKKTKNKKKKNMGLVSTRSHSNHSNHTKQINKQSAYLHRLLELFMQPAVLALELGVLLRQ
jgi:hypothetical protein